MAYDFGPRVNPYGGVSLSDLVAAKTTPLTQFAQALPPLAQALMLRRQQAMQQAQQQQFSRALTNPALASGGSLSPEDLMAGIQGGFLDARGALELSPANQARRQAEIEDLKAKTEARKVKAEADRAFMESGEGYILINDPFNQTSTKVPVSGTKSKDGRPLAVVSAQMTDAEKLRGLITTLQNIAKEPKQGLGQSGDSGGLGEKPVPKNPPSGKDEKYSAFASNAQGVRIGFNKKTRKWETVSGK